MTPVNPLFDPKTDNQEIHHDSQKVINAPLAGGSLSEEDQAFLKVIMDLVDAGKINIHSPSSLLNESVYESLEHEAKAKADMAAMAMLPKIRNVVDWEKSHFDSNHQVKNLIHSLRLDKERLEAHEDLFIF